MTEVESSPLMLDHTFPTKEVLLLRITEEANLSGCHVSSKRSDDYRVQVVGSSDSLFKIYAVFHLPMDGRLPNVKLDITYFSKRRLLHWMVVLN